MNENSISMTFENNVRGMDKLSNYITELKKLKVLISDVPDNFSVNINIDKNSKKIISEMAESTAQFSNQTSSAQSNSEKLSKTVDSSTNNFSNFVSTLEKAYKGLKSIVSEMSEFASYSSDYIESLNLMDVAFQGATEEGRKLVNTMSEMYGLDENSLTETIGLFKQLSNAMGMSNELGTKLSSTMTQMAIDISSLYNSSFERATSVLESAMSGQTKPIRSLTGADITQSTLQVTLDNHGIDTTVNSLSYLEKRLLIVTSLIEQLEESQNDYGRTIESVSNQMKVFDQQTQRLSRAIGNLFIPLLSKALPYLNAILMTMTEIINYIAKLLGFNEEDYDYFGETDSSILDLEDDLDDATESAENLKRGLRGFDKLNVITTPTTTSSNSGSGVSSDIEALFLDSIEDYENSLENVEMKATKIRDRIMEWLGFTKEINEETGEVSFTFDHITGGTVLGALAVGTTIYNGVKGIFGFLEKIGVLKFDNITKIFSGEGITSFLSQLGKSIKTIAGLIAFIDGTVDLLNIDEDTSLGSGVFSSVETVLGGALTGSRFGSIGAIVGAVTGLVTVLGTLTEKLFEAGGGIGDLLVAGAQMSEKFNLFWSVLSKGIDIINDLTGSSIPTLSEWLQENFANEIHYDLDSVDDEIVEKYEEIKDNLEDVYKNIELLNMGLVIDEDTQNKVVDSVVSLCKEISNNVETSKAEMNSSIQEMLKNGIISEEETTDTIAKINEYYDDIASKTETAQKEITRILKEEVDKQGKLTEQGRKDIEKQYEILEENTVQSLASNYGNQQAIYEDLKRTKTELSKEAASEIIQAAVETKDETIEAAKEQYNQTIEQAQKMLEIGAINEDTYNEIVDKAVEAKNDAITAAEEQYAGIWEEFTSSQGDIANYIDKDDGHIKSNWEMFWDSISNIGTYFDKAYQGVKDGTKKISESISNWWDDKIVAWWDDNVAPIFTKKYWSNKIDQAEQGILNKVREILQGIADKINTAFDGINDIIVTVNDKIGTNIPEIEISIPRFKTGLDFVPNDYFPAILDYGERVLTKEENRDYNKGIIRGQNVVNQSKPINQTIVFQMDGKIIAEKTLSNIQDMASANGKPIVLGV